MMALLLGAVVLCTVANVLLKLGMKRAGSVWRAVFEPRVLLGVLCLAGFFGCYAYTLTRLPVSLANPVTALNIILAAGYAAFALGERISPRRWLGIALVTLGALLVSLQA